MTPRFKVAMSGLLLIGLGAALGVWTSRLLSRQPGSNYYAIFEVSPHIVGAFFCLAAGLVCLVIAALPPSTTAAPRASEST